MGPGLNLKCYAKFGVNVCIVLRILGACKWIMIVLACCMFVRTYIRTHERYGRCALQCLATVSSAVAASTPPRIRRGISATGLRTVSKHLATVFVVLRPLAIFIPVTFLRLTCVYELLGRVTPPWGDTCNIDSLFQLFLDTNFLTTVAIGIQHILRG